MENVFLFAGNAAELPVPSAIRAFFAKLIKKIPEL